MTTLNKILLALLGLTVIAALGFVFYKERQFAQMQDTINKSMVAQKELADQIMRSQSSYASKQDLETFAKQNQINLDAIKSDLKTLNASLSSVNTIAVNSNGQNKTNVSSTSTTPATNPAAEDKYGYLKNVQHLDIQEDFGKTSVPVGNVAFDASKEAPWTLNVNPRQYNVVNVVGTDEDGRQYFYNKFSIKTDGKDYPLNITKAETIQQYPDAKFSFWNPKLHMFATGSVGVSTVPVRGEFTPGVSMSIMSYGKTKDKSDINVLELGVGYGVDSGKPVASIMPVSFNVASIIPQNVITHTYVGPSVEVNTSGNVYVGAGLSVGF